MSVDMPVRPGFEDLVYFSLLNYWTAHHVSLRRFDFFSPDTTDKRIMKLLKAYTKAKQKPREEHQGEINPAVCATVIYQDMIKDWGAIGGFIPEEELKEYEGPDSLLEKIVNFGILDEETAVILGGIVKDKVGFSFPTAANYQCARHKISESTLLSVFFPEDFSDINYNSTHSTRGSRNLGALGAVLLGPVEGREYAETLAIKQSMYGQWGKMFRMSAIVNKKGVPTYYLLEEIVFVTENQIGMLNGIDPERLFSQVKDTDNLRPDLERSVYMVKRTYTLQMPKENHPEDYGREDLLQSRLELTGAEIIRPQEIFDYVHSRRA
jgi:hypothetical protein